MLRCRMCNAICDQSDLVNGVCDDCREEIKIRNENRERAALMLIGEGLQMTLDDLEVDNGGIEQEMF